MIWLRKHALIRVAKKFQKNTGFVFEKAGQRGIFFKYKILSGQKKINAKAINYVNFVEKIKKTIFYCIPDEEKSTVKFTVTTNFIVNVIVKINKIQYCQQ